MNWNAWVMGTCVLAASCMAAGGDESTLHGLSEPAQRQTVLFDYAEDVDVLATNGGVSYDVVPDPERKGVSSLAVTYPKYVEGRAEWPALKLAGKELTTSDWSGHDLVLLRVYNPEDEVVDVGFFVRGKEGRYGPHAKLQPNVWNTVVWKVSDIAAQTSVDTIAEVHVFMTRPSREHTVYLRDLSLASERDLTSDPLPLPFIFSSFEGAEDIDQWQTNGISAERDEGVHTHGDASVKLTYHAYAEGHPRWPAFQARYLEGSLPIRDWRGYDRFAFDVVNRTDAAAPLNVYFRDQSGSIAKRPATIPAGDSLTFSADLRGLGLDLSQVMQVDLYMSEPSREIVLNLDRVRLESGPKTAAADLMADLDRTIARIDDLGDAVDAGLAGKFRHIRDTVVAVAQGFQESPTFGGVRVLAGVVDAASRQMAALRRDVQVAGLEMMTRKVAPEASFAVGLADSMTKVMIRDLPLDDIRSLERANLSMARNERESLQVVVIGTDAAVSDVRVEPGPFVHPESGYTLPTDAVTSSVVGYVKTEKPPYDVPYVGWWPDPILDFQRQATVSPGEAVPFWIRIHMPADAPAGDYEGTLVAAGEGTVRVPIGVRLRVFDFAVPDMSYLPTACSFYDSIRKMWGAEMSQEEYQRRLTQAAEFLAAYKIDLDHIYRRSPEKPADLDLPLAQLKMLRDRGMLRRFMIFHVATPRKVADVNHPSVQKTIDHSIESLDYWVPKLRAEGLLDYAYLYGYDEVRPEAFAVMAKVIGGIKEAYPDIPFMTTAYDHSYGMETELGGRVDWWVPLTPRYIPEKVAEARARGMDVWWYICIGPKHPYCNWLIEYPAIEARLLMGAMTARYRPAGFLYYALTRWPVNKAPITSGPYTDWDPRSFKTNNGDGSLFCAGPDGLLATIRAENFRDGMEDNDYMVILRRLLAEAHARPRKRWGLRRAIRKAENANTVPTDLVTDLKEYSRDPGVLREWRLNVGQAIEDLAAAME